MTLSPLVLGGAGLLMAGMAALLLFGDSKSDRRLRERVLATKEAKTTEARNPDALFMGALEQRHPVIRVAEWLGYRADLPKGYAASLKTTVLIAGILGTLAFRMSETVLSPALSAAIAIVVALLAIRQMFVRKTKSYTTLLFRQIPDTMSLMLRAVRAGLPVAEAIRNISRESMSPTREEFTRVAGEAALGMPIEVTLRRLYDRTGIQEYAFFSVVIGLHGQTGGNLSETIENLADMVRRRVAMVNKGKALSAEGRMSAIIVGALPFAVAGLTSLTNPQYMREFLINPSGHMLIGVFSILLSIGLFATHWLVKRSTED